MKHKFILFAIVIIIFSSFIVFQFYFFKAEIRKNTRELSGNLTAENTKLAIELKIIRQQLSLLELRLQTIETTTANIKQETGNQSEKANNPVVQLAPRQPEKPETGQNTPLPVTVSQPQPEEAKPGPILPKSAPARDDVQISTAYTAGLAAFEKGEYTRARLAFGQLLKTDPPIWEAQLSYLWSAYYENPARAAADPALTALLAALPAEYDQTGEISRLKGLLALEQGNSSLGMQYLQQALVLAPGNEELRKLIQVVR